MPCSCPVACPVASPAIAPSRRRRSGPTCRTRAPPRSARGHRRLWPTWCSRGAAAGGGSSDGGWHLGDGAVFVRSSDGGGGAAVTAAMVIYADQAKTDYGAPGRCRRLPCLDFRSVWRFLKQFPLLNGFRGRLSPGRTQSPAPCYQGCLLLLLLLRSISFGRASTASSTPWSSVFAAGRRRSWLAARAKLLLLRAVPSVPP